jgi:hypothetical protein
MTNVRHDVLAGDSEFLPGTGTDESGGPYRRKSTPRKCRSQYGYRCLPQEQPRRMRGAQLHVGRFAPAQMRNRPESSPCKKIGSCEVSFPLRTALSGSSSPIPYCFLSTPRSISTLADTTSCRPPEASPKPCAQRRANWPRRPCRSAPLSLLPVPFVPPPFPLAQLLSPFRPSRPVVSRPWTLPATRSRSGVSLLYFENGTATQLDDTDVCFSPNRA